MAQPTSAGSEDAVHMSATSEGVKEQAKEEIETAVDTHLLSAILDSERRGRGGEKY